MCGREFQNSSNSENQILVNYEKPMIAFIRFEGQSSVHIPHNLVYSLLFPASFIY